MKKVILAAAAMSLIAGPALAQSFYVVRDASTKKCTVVTEKPAATTTTVVGDGVVYKTRTEADAAVKTTKVCTDN